MPDENLNITTNGLVLPKLEYLHIEDLSFNVLDLFMEALAPGSYHVTVNLYPAFSEGYFRSEEDLLNQSPVASEDEICAVLRTVKIDKLIICLDDHCLWSSNTGLRTLLKSVPGVKTLIMNFYTVDHNLLKALKQPPRPPSWQSTRNDLFPKFETIEFHCSTVPSSLGDLKKGFRDLLASHPVKKMSLGVYFDDKGTEASLDEGNEVIDWFKATVPEFHLYRRQTDPPEMISSWQLWDN
ncbi:unnamed protein product [Rhizoctonia solani]|uniref:Uncharacterized protein n=1 Tax=Rhizoctonia solani TaxID=456999 RepID=A0A8H2XW43_9AGAM|nr:unnamed protein product [Rhizoctonia solani]